MGEPGYGYILYKYFDKVSKALNTPKFKKKQKEYPNFPPEKNKILPRERLRLCAEFLVPP